MAATINLMDNPRFKELIDGFSEVIKTSGEQGLDAARKKCTDFFLNADPFRAEVETISRLEIEGPDGNALPLQIYQPHTEQALPVLIYLHRGGWVFGNNAESEPVCRLLAQHLNCLVVAVEYRLSPENPFPKPLEDCYAATAWAAKHIGMYGGNPEQLILCGESAGGNLAAATAMLAKKRQGPAIASQLLIYPIITANLEEEAYANCPDRHFLTKDAMQFMWGAYLQSPENAQNPHASLDCAADLSRLPPAVIVTGEYDPLCKEGEMFAHSLEEAGVAVKTLRVPEAIHGFLDLPLYSAEQKINWVQQIRALMPNAEHCAGSTSEELL